ncbi:MAG: sulfatase [Myxococcota bacterium]|nr:sulfatase [Myxococcota bacterium]
MGQPAEAQYSILLISWDTVRADHTSAYGGRAETPHLEKLVERGALFENAITHIPETALSHWSVFTGVEPELHGDVPGTGGSRYRGPTLAEIAKAYGYNTAAFIGGVTLAKEACGLDRGFDVYDDRHNWESTDLKRPGQDVVDRAADWMNKQNGKTLTFVHLFDAHTPYRPPPPFDTRYAPGQGNPPEGFTPGPADLESQIALYDGEIAYLDSLLPPLIEAAGPDTIIALFSDHGESFEHGYLYNHRDSLWDSTLKVPLVLAGPGVPPKSVFDQQVALTDLFPTVLSLSGLPGEAKSQGQDLLNSDKSRPPIVHSIARPFTEHSSFSARSRQFKGIWKSPGTTLGYALETDPDERLDLGEIPVSLAQEKERYSTRLKESASLQRKALIPRPIPEETIQQLEALGYGER